LLQQLNSPREGAAEASEVSQASHTEPGLVDPRFGYERQQSHLQVSTSQIELRPTQFVNNQMAALDRIVGSLEDESVPTTTSAPSFGIDLHSPPSDSNGVIQANTPAPADSGGSELDSTTSSSPTRTHRLHPLASELDAAP
jgi:hypothetical protein